MYHIEAKKWCCFTRRRQLLTQGDHHPAPVVEGRAAAEGLGGAAGGDARCRAESQPVQSRLHAKGNDRTLV